MVGGNLRRQEGHQQQCLPAGLRVVAVALVGRTAMQTRTNWAIRVIVALAALAVVAVVLVGNWRLPVPAPAAAPRPYSEAVRAPAEATVFPQVLSVYDAAAHDGMWYVLDVQGTQVHRVDPVTGSVRTFGRKGEGPGEFDIPNGIVVHGDSVLVLDFRTLRVFGLEGQHYDDRRVGVRGTCKLEDGLSVSGALLLLLGCSDVGEVTYHVVVEADDESLTELAAVSRVLGDIGGVVVLGPASERFHPRPSLRRLHEAVRHRRHHAGRRVPRVDRADPCSRKCRTT